MNESAIFEFIAESLKQAFQKYGFEVPSDAFEDIKQKKTYKLYCYFVSIYEEIFKSIIDTDLLRLFHITEEEYNTYIEEFKSFETFTNGYFCNLFMRILTIAIEINDGVYNFGINMKKIFDEYVKPNSFFREICNDVYEKHKDAINKLMRFLLNTHYDEFMRGYSFQS